MAVYGNMLCAFPELFKQFDYFQMKPQVKSSYSKRYNLVKIRGILQYLKQSELKVENDTFADINVPTLWTKQKLNVGNYFIQQGEEVFRIVNHATWLYEGGFNCYVLATVVGNTDSQEPFEYVDLGQNSYG